MAAEAGDPAAAGAVVPEIRRVLVIAAHPDDETLTAGALVATLAARCEVDVLTCTRGERGEMIGADLAPLTADPAALTGYRTAELERALAALGVAHHTFLDAVDGGPRLVDSGMRWDEDAPLVRAVPAADAGADAFSNVPLERTIAALAAVVDAQQPDLVIVDEPGGGYGHPDHRRAHEVTMAAVGQATHKPAFVAYPVRPLSAVRAAEEWLRSRPDRPATGVDGVALTVADPDGPVPSIVVADDAVDVAVDVRPQLPALLGALQSHRSQVQSAQLVPADTLAVGGQGYGWYALSNGLLQPIHGTAWLAAAPGWGDGAQLRSAVERLLGHQDRPTADGRWYRPTMIGFSVVLGAVLAAVGTTFHRVAPPWGLLVALVAVAAGGLLARTFVDRVGQLGYGAAAIATVLTMTYLRPGDDILVTGEPIGVAWIIGAIVAAVLVPSVVPRRWLAD